MKNTNKQTFWQALVVALIIFWTGILVGIYFENYRINTIKDFYFGSETYVADFEASLNMVFDSKMNCAILNEKGVLFADRIYAEALRLEKYDESNKITEELLVLHRRYDLLRTILWSNIIDVKERCNKTNLNTIVYFYDYVEPSVQTKAVQNTMSNYLIDLKSKYGDRIVLIPIAVDTGVMSLEILMEKYGIDETPVILVNEEHKFENVESLRDIEGVLI